MLKYTTNEQTSLISKQANSSYIEFSTAEFLLVEYDTQKASYTQWYEYNREWKR